MAEAISEPREQQINHLDNNMTSATAHEINRRFDSLLADPRLNGDQYSRPNLRAFRDRHIRLAQAIDRFLDGPRRTIIDVGCHDGFFMRLCGDLGFDRYVGVDYFPLPSARSFLTDFPGAELMQANFNEGRFLRQLPDATADTVVSTEVFEHLYNHPIGYLQECWRVLRPGGLLLFSTPNPCTLANALRLATGRPVSWGAVEFARQPKILPSGEPLAVWDIHFREYAPSELATVIGVLPAAQVRDQGFLANRADPSDRFAKRAALWLVHRFGLGNWRPLCPTQYLIIQKEPTPA